jgi:hypothetical protein
LPSLRLTATPSDPALRPRGSGLGEPRAQAFHVRSRPIPPPTPRTMIERCARARDRGRRVTRGARGRQSLEHDVAQAAAAIWRSAGWNRSHTLRTAAAASRRPDGRAHRRRRGRRALVVSTMASAARAALARGRDRRPVDATS